MAFFAPLVPVLASLGGGSAVVGGVLAGTAIVGAGMAAKGAHDAASIASAEAKLQAKQAGDAARGREIERKRDLLRALSAQHATAGAQGVAFAGSKAAIAMRDINDNRDDLQADRANTRTQQRVLRARASNARQAGTLDAVTSVLDAGMNLARAAA